MLFIEGLLDRLYKGGDEGSFFSEAAPASSADEQQKEVRYEPEFISTGSGLVEEHISLRPWLHGGSCRSRSEQAGQKGDTKWHGQLSAQHQQRRHC
jgi:hypothetical protein